MTKKAAKVRAVAAEIVDAVVYGGRSLDTTIAEMESRIDSRDRSLLRMLAFGSLRQHWRLKSHIDVLIEKPLRKRDRVIQSLLAVGLYQIENMRIPDHAVLSETVEAARVLRRPKLAGLVNACLRRFTRDGLASAKPSSDEACWNHPAWLINAIRNDWPDDWQAILTANNERAPMCLRVNASISNADQYLERLRDAGIHAELVPGIVDAVTLSEPMPVEDLPGFADGAVSVQDGAAQIAGRWLLHERLGETDAIRVLDACAAPGGKSGHLKEIGGSRIALVALDSDAARLGRVTENLERIGADATIIAADASNPEEWWDGEHFDAILLDAPCSASGVIRRHPDIKLLRRESDLARLAALQSASLTALWSLLAPGGTLLYVTCSVLALENDNVIGAFLETHADASENDVLPNNNIRDLMRKKACGYQVLPGTANLDGFYYAALQKKKVS